MAADGLVRIEPASPVYQEVARLYRIAHDLNPGGQDLWNGELYARTDDLYGSFARDGSFKLYRRRFLDQLTGGSPSGDPIRQAQAMATLLHETNHTRTALDAPEQPNAIRSQVAVGLN